MFRDKTRAPFVSMATMHVFHSNALLQFYIKYVHINISFSGVVDTYFGEKNTAPRENISPWSFTG